MSDTNTKEDNNSFIIDDLELDGSISSEKTEKNPPEEKTSNLGKNEEENVILSKTKLALIKKIITNIQESNNQLLKIIASTISSEDEEKIRFSQSVSEDFNLNTDEKDPSGSRIIEGIFDGENMIGPDGKQYSVPANYASKSKLIEGDVLKLTITDKGTFIYKQIKPIDRRRVICDLKQDENGNYIAYHGDEKWRVLTASVTYYKGQTGDEVVVIVPAGSRSKWAAVDNIVRKV